MLPQPPRQSLGDAQKQMLLSVQSPVSSEAVKICKTKDKGDFLKSVFSVIGLCYMLGLLTGMLLSDFSFFILFIIFVMSIPTTFLYKGKNKTSVLVGMLCIGIGVSVYPAVCNIKTSEAAVLYNRTAQIKAQITEKSYNSKGKCVYTLITEEISPENQENYDFPQKLKLKITTKSDFYAEPYEIIRIKVLFSEPEKSTYKYHSISEGIFVNTSVLSEEPYIVGKSDEITYQRIVGDIRFSVNQKLRQYFMEKQSGLISALLLGDKSVLDNSVKSSFRYAGISHIIAISGLHLSIITGFIFLLFAKIIQSRKRAAYVTMVFILLYTLLTGMQYSVIRSAIMNFVYMLGIICNKKPQAINSLGLAGFAITLVNPLSIGNIGLLMSFSATLGIIVLQNRIYKAFTTFFRVFSDRLFKLKPFGIIIRFVSGCVSVSLSATIFSLPVMVFVFESFSIYFLISNLIITSVVPVVIVLGFILAGLLYIPAFDFAFNALAFPEKILCDFIIGISDDISKLPNAVIPLDDIYIKPALIAALVIVTIFFAAGGFTVKNTKLCILLSAAVSVIIISSGYFIMSQSVSLYILANNGGITLLEKSPDRVNILLCGGDNYHLDKAESEIGNEKINSMLVLGESVAYTRYSYQLAESFDINQLILYDDGTDYGYLSNVKSFENAIFSNENSNILYGIFKLTPVKVKNKIWVYIDIEGNSVLISPQNCDCKDIDEKYRTVDTVIFQKNVENKNVISAKNTFICENNSTNEVENSINIKNKTVIISIILKRRTFIWQN